MAIEEFTGELDQVRQPQAPQTTGASQPQVVEFTGELDKQTTQNPLMGGLARILELGGAGAEALQRSTAGLRKQMDEEGSGIDKFRPEFMKDAAVKERQQRFTNWAQQQAKDIGYEPSTNLKDLGDNPLKVIPFVAERVITSSPDMAAAAVAFTPYVMARTNEILNERLKNDNRTYDQATVGDVATATAAAISEATLERFATKRILPGGKGVAAAPGAAGAVKRVGKEVGLQGSTEALEELSSYGGETIGTKKGFQPGEAGERMLEAGIVGAGLGGGARGAREIYDRYNPPVVEELPKDAKVEPLKEEPVATPKTPVDEFTDEILGKQPEKKTAETQADPEAPITKQPIEVKKDAGTIAGVAIQEIPVDELNLSKDVPQFKAEADEQGIVEPLKSRKYDRVGTPPIQVWKRADGTLEVISGRHRWDLARRTGEKTIPAQVFDENEGFNADMAQIMDSELNIRDEKGKITDYVNYFKKASELGATKDDFEGRGLLDGTTGRRAYAVTVQGSDELIHALNAGQIKDDQAYRIAAAVPNDPRLQALGLKLVNEKPLEQAINILHAAKTIEPKAPEMGGDLFGFDDSGLKLAEDMGKLALEKQRALSADINTIERAGKQPAIAKKYGIDVKDPEAIKAKVKEMKAQRAAWDNWASDPKLVDQIRREISGEPVAEAAPPEAKPEVATIKIVKVEPSKWAGTGFGTKGASYGVEGDPNIMIRRESHGWTAFDKTTNDSRFGETKAELEKELANNPFNKKPEAAPIEKPAKTKPEYDGVDPGAYVEKKESYRHRTTADVEWLTKRSDGTIVAESKTKREAERWADMYRLSKESFFKKYPDLEDKSKRAEEKPVEKTPEQQLQDLVDEYNKKGDEVKAAMDIMEKAKAAGEDYRKQEGDYNERLAELVEIGKRHDKFKREYTAAKEEGDKVKSVKMRRDPMGTDYLVTLNDGRTAAIYKSDPGGDGGLGAWHIDEMGYRVPGPSQLGHVSSVLGYTKKEAVAAVAKKLDELEKYRIKKEPKAEEVTPSFVIDGGFASWTESRIDNILREYGYNSDDKRTKAMAVRMSPDDFLGLTTDKEELKRIESETKDLNISKLNKEILNINLYIEHVKDDMFQVKDHEGRHRMFAMKKAGIESVPVVLDFRDGKQRVSLDKMWLAAQKFYDGSRASLSTYVYDAIPINHENAKELRSEFGKESEVMFSYELTPEEKITPAEKKAAAEREAKQIADRERDFFELTPRTPKEGAGDYLQQDLLGAAGFTYDDYKKFIDKKATDPGEPLILRDVTMSESDGYNDEANAKVDESVNDELGAVPNMKDVEVDEKDITHTLERQAQAVEDYIELASQGKVTAKEFMASVRAAAASGEIAPDVFNAIEKIYKLYPNVLEGIRFEAVSGAKKTGKYREAGHYQPLARMIRLFKDTSGVLEPDTVRHEIAHAMEQMMTPEQKRLIVRAWRDELIRASKAETTDEGHLFFINIAKYLRSPSFGTLKAMIKSMPNVSYYQYVNPSEYWAVNAEKILKSRGEGASKLKAMMSNLQEGVRAAFGTTNFSVGNKVFDQILNGDRFSNRMILSYVRKTKMKNYLGKEAPPATWDLGSSSWIDNMIYLWQDKNIDLLQIQKVIGDIRDETNGYVKEALSHSRTSTRMEEFGMNYVKPLADVMDKYNISKQQLHEYMLARHAPEANLEIGKINPSMGDSGSSITTEEANNYIRSLGDKRKAELDEAAKFADKIIHHTQDILVESGYELDTTIKGWNKKYKHYVPLYRKDIEYPKSGRLHGSAKASGAFSKSRMGSQKEVDDITKWIVIDHLRAIEKIENARVKNSLVALVAENPNPDFWFALDPSAVKDKDAMLKKLEKFGCDEKALEGFMKAPNVGVINKQTGLVEYKPDANIIRSGNVVATRMDGKDWYVVFNANNPRAWRMAQSINNQDVAQLDTAMRMHSYVSRFVAQINTQVNIAFGPFNFIKDSFGAYLNLSTTKLNGKTAEIYKKGWANIPRLYKIMQEERETGKAVTSKEAEKWYEFRKEGGVTGTKARFTDPKKEKDLLEDALKSMQAGNVTKMVHVTGKWISDWNDVFENAVRLATYETGLENGLSKQESAYIAKDLINFNRKGAKTQSANALFAFFNASVQGIERTARTLKGPAGVKIMTGGIMLGVVQALALHALGYRDDEPKEYIKEKNLIIPIIGTGRYFTIPYPPVFSMFPGLGRIATETIIGWSNGRNVKHKMFDAMSMIAGSFNPLGNNFGWQMITPTPYDPIVAIIENKNAFGNPIYKEDRNNNPQVAYERTRDTTWEGFKLASQFLTYASGGDKYNKGKIDFTGDEISFLLGYYTGGTGRLLMNTFGAAKDFTTGDETPLYKIPLVGKLIGEVESQAATKDRFYANVKELAEMENVVKKKAEEKENVAEYFKKHPQARLINMANRIENDITALNKQRHELIKRGATVEQIRRIEKIKAEKMKVLNDQYDKLR